MTGLETPEVTSSQPPQLQPGSTREHQGTEQSQRNFVQSATGITSLVGGEVTIT